jgi:antibiotic biosynthesis monooxygenase (ABM) superfamily enzyme
MAKHSSSILELARRGAQHRYEELQSELSSLMQQFPDLRGTAREIVKRGRRAVQAAAAELQPKKRRTMSAAARAKIALAQRARWAKRKAAAAAQGAPAGVKARKKR